MSNFNLNQDIILENNRVLMRPLLLTDVENLLEFSLQEPEIWKYSLVQGGGEENLRHYIKSALEAKATLKEYPFIVFDKKTGRYAGSTRFYDISLPFQTLQLGYTWYGSAFQGTGLNKHCKFLLLELAFERMDMLRVEFRADNRNEKSKAAIKSIGGVHEGVLRCHLPALGGLRRDSAVFSILKEEWLAGGREKLLKLIIN